MKTMKRSTLKLIAVMLFGAIFFIACSDDEPAANGTVALKMTAASPTGSTISSGRTNATTVITDIKISIREIEFEFDEDDSHFQTDSSFDEEVKLNGPFVLDILDQNAFVEQLITTIDLPNAVYEEVKFKLHKNTDAGDMNGKSIMITGTIDGKPFTFWHDIDEALEIDFENAATDLTINGNSTAIVISLKLDQLFSSVKGGVNLSLAGDGDGDGVIEINPGSTDNDGNKDIADAIKNLLAEVMDLIDGK